LFVEKERAVRQNSHGFPHATKGLGERRQVRILNYPPSSSTRSAADICKRALVRSCSDSIGNTAAGERKEDSHIRRTRYIEHLSTVDQETLLVSLSDKIHNACSILRDLRKPEIGTTGTTVWARFKNSKEDTLWYYRQLANAFRERLPGQLANELHEIVDVLKTQ
jgi:hypothetical protein